ncbi:flagellar protein FlaG [Paenibacillus sp. GCM10027626]|uniref:flagellar protein FlaG n=1 Tax=Paenibacillus sp. GCM10027626 TaxID=3273411 RepID=UPI003642AC71
MSMNIGSVNGMTGYVNDRHNGEGETRGSAPAANLNNISSVKALAKAELSGTKVTIGDEQVIRNIERVLKVIQGPDTLFEMSVHKETNAIVIKVLDKDTGDLIREVPPEKTLDLVAKFMEINGILIDEKV